MGQRAGLHRKGRDGHALPDKGPRVIKEQLGRPIITVTVDATMIFKLVVVTVLICVIAVIIIITNSRPVSCLRTFACPLVGLIVVACD